MKKILGIVFIILGIGAFSIPIVFQMYTKYRQGQMLDYFMEQIEESNNSDSNSDKTDPEHTLNPEQEYNELELSVEDSDDATKKEKKNDTIKNILKNQKVIGIIEIKKIKITFAVVEGTDRENIRGAIGHMKGTADIGQNGNCVLAGHRGGMYGTFFKNIHKLDSGDAVVLTDENGNIFTYEVYDSYVVEPSDMSVVENTDDERQLTLISCENNGTKRLIVKCRIK